MNRPKVTVAAIILKKGKLLLEKRAIEPFKEYWCLPGGHIEKGESAIDAVKREIREETGLNVKSCKFLFYFDEIITEIDWHSVVLVFLCKTSGVLRPQKEEVKELNWFNLKDVLKLRLAFRHKDLISKFIEEFGTQKF